MRAEVLGLRYADRLSAENGAARHSRIDRDRRQCDIAVGTKLAAIDLVTIGETIVIRVPITGIGPVPLDLDQVGNAIAIRVLFRVRYAIGITVRVERIQPRLKFSDVVQPVPIVVLRRVSHIINIKVRIRNPRDGHAVGIRLGNGHIVAVERNLPAIHQSVAIGIRIDRQPGCPGSVCHLDTRQTGIEEPLRGQVRKGCATIERP